MGSLESYRAQVNLLRSWGYRVNEQAGCWGRNNGLSWVYGDRVAQVNHHYVCPLSPPGNAQAYVNTLARGSDIAPVVNWVLDAAGVLYLIGTGPCNHAGRGDSSVLARVRAGKAPLGWHPPNNDFNGNAYYDGVELLHPGDSSPYPDKMIDALVALNASRCIVLKQSSNTAIMHGEHSNRKIDMSWRGGPNGDGNLELRKRVAARMAGGKPPVTTPPKPPTPKPPVKDWFDMATEADLKRVVDERLKFWLPRTLNVLMNGQGNQAYGPNSTIALDGKGISRATVDQQMARTVRIVKVAADGKETAHDAALKDVWGEQYTLSSRIYWRTNWLYGQLRDGVAAGQKSVGSTIAATLTQCQAIWNKVNK